MKILTEDGGTGFSATCWRQPARETSEESAVKRKKFYPEPTNGRIFSNHVGKSGSRCAQCRLRWRKVVNKQKKRPADKSGSGRLDISSIWFDRKVLTPEKITTKFVTVPAKFVLEVDVNVELPDRNSDLFQEYVVRKVRRLFTFGTEKVIWVFTKSKTVISATSDAPWQFYEGTWTWNSRME